MRKAFLLTGIVLLNLLWRCERIEDPNPSEKPEIRIIDETIFDQPVNLSPNQLVVRFDNALTDQEKENLRREFFVLNTEGCSCGDDNIELWTIDIGKLNIETALSNLKNKKDEEGIEGDREFIFRMYKGVIESPNDPSDLIVNPNLHVSTATDVNIAVIDTGVDIKFFTYSGHGPFLYENENSNSCAVGKTGWNFVDNSYDTRDPNGHGTYVTRLITSGLDKHNIRYKILPVVAFNISGNGSYWNIVCAMNYIKNFPDINIVNASFGGYINTENTIMLKNIIKELGTEHNVLVICSAGNGGLDTDASGNDHSPSGYDLDNVLSVGGHENDPDISLELFSDNSVFGLIKHPQSNYGKINTDIAASFINILQDKNIFGRVTRNSELIGTSFSTAEITSKCALLYKNNPNASPLAIKNMFLNSAFYARSLENEIKDGKVMLHDDFVANSRN